MYICVCVCDLKTLVFLVEHVLNAQVFLIPVSGGKCLALSLQVYSNFRTEHRYLQFLGINALYKEISFFFFFLLVYEIL